MRTIGRFYREEILSLPPEKLAPIELPTNWDDTRIEKDLFGWKLYSGADFIECRSEEEARYLKVFIDSRVTEVFVPKDDQDLKTILPKLENLKRKIDEIVNSYLETVLNRKIRERIRHEVFVELTK
jgi:hypothetical protein